MTLTALFRSLYEAVIYVVQGTIVRQRNPLTNLSPNRQ
jgi:hypothetical protein